MPQTKLLLTLLTSLTLSAELALPPLAAAQTSQQTTAFTITGLVVERDGSPLYGVIVRAGNAKTMTNAGGRFTLTLATRPEDGRQALTLSAVGKKTQQVTFVEGHPLRVSSRMPSGRSRRSSSVPAPISMPLTYVPARVSWHRSI